MIIQIINKPPQAKLTQHRYAEQSKELMEELIRIGFMLDNKDESDLVKLADACTATLQKQAILPLLAAIAAGLTLIGTYNNFAYLSQGVGNDCDNAIDALDKFSQEVPDISDQLSDLVNGIKYIKSLYDQALHFSNSFKSVKHDNVVQGAVDVHNSSTGVEAFKLLEQYKKAANLLAERIIKVYVPSIKATEPPQDRSSSSIWTGLSSAWHALVGSAKNDVLKTLVGANIDLIGQGGLVGSLLKSVEQITAKERAMQAYVEQNKDTLVDYLSDATKDDKTAPTPTQTPSDKRKLVDELKEDKSKGITL